MLAAGASTDWLEGLRFPGVVFEVAPILVTGGLYRRRTQTLAARGSPVPRARQAAFAAALALILIAVVSPIAGLSDQLLSVHMAQHLLLGDLAALGIAFGVTGAVLAPVLRLRPLRPLHVLAHPAVALPLWMLNLYAWHLAVAYQAALESPAVHALMHGLFIAFGVAMWLPVAGPLPVPRWFGNWAKLGYVTLVRFSGAVLANIFLWSGALFYDDYRAGAQAWGINPLADQSVAGAILMVEGMIVTVCTLGWAFMRAARLDEDRQTLLDFAADRGVALSEERAARAARAGRTDALRERLSRGQPAAGAKQTRDATAQAADRKQANARRRPFLGPGKRA